MPKLRSVVSFALALLPGCLVSIPDVVPADGGSGGGDGGSSCLACSPEPLSQEVLSKVDYVIRVPGTPAAVLWTAKGQLGRKEGTMTPVKLPLDTPTLLTMDGEKVYYYDRGPTNKTSRGIFSLALSLGGTPKLVDPGTDAYVQGLAVDAESVLWSEAGTMGGSGWIHVKNKLTGSKVDWQTQTTMPGPLVVLEGKAYVATQSYDDGSAVERFDLATGVVTVFKQSGLPAGHVWGLAVSGRQVLWRWGKEDDDTGVCAAPCQGGVLSLDVDSEIVTDLIPAHDHPGPRGIVVDEASIYWTDNDSGDVMRMPRKGSPADAVKMADKQPEPNELAQDDTYIYWTNYGMSKAPAAPGGIYRLPKCCSAGVTCCTP